METGRASTIGSQNLTVGADREGGVRSSTCGSEEVTFGGVGTLGDRIASESVCVIRQVVGSLDRSGTGGDDRRSGGGAVADALNRTTLTIVECDRLACCDVDSQCIDLTGHRATGKCQVSSGEGGGSDCLGGVGAGIHFDLSGELDNTGNGRGSVPWLITNVQELPDSAIGEEPVTDVGEDRSSARGGHGAVDSHDDEELGIASGSGGEGSARDERRSECSTGSSDGNQQPCGTVDGACQGQVAGDDQVVDLILQVLALGSSQCLSRRGRSY